MQLYQRQIEELEEQINNVGIKEEEELSTVTLADGEELEKQRAAASGELESAQNEKTQALMNLELQQIATIEQQISGYNDTILSLETNLTSSKLQLDAVNDADTEAKESVAILTEKGNIASEILTYEDKVKECEKYLNSYDIQNDNCIVKATVPGYFYVSHELKKGSLVQEGTSIGTIYPEAESKYYAEVYVENADIAKDISVDQSTGYSYYIVRVSCDNMTLKGKDGDEVTLMNGMACQAKIVVDEKTVLSYLLEKIDLKD